MNLARSGSSFSHKVSIQNNATDYHAGNTQSCGACFLTSSLQMYRHTYKTDLTFVKAKTKWILIYVIIKFETGTEG